LARLVHPEPQSVPIAPRQIICRAIPRSSLHLPCRQVGGASTACWQRRVHSKGNTLLPDARRCRLAGSRWFLARLATSFFLCLVAIPIRLVRLLQPIMPLITGNAFGRTLLFTQFSAHPWKLSPEMTLKEVRSYATAPSFRRIIAPACLWRDAKGCIATIDKKSARNRMGTESSCLFPQPS
jgi:hypothetical protein